VDRQGLFLRSIDSGETRSVSVPAELKARVWDIRWLPEGGKLLATVTSAGVGNPSIWAITVLGEGAPRKLHEPGAFPAISPDGRWIAFGSGGPIGWEEIWVCDINCAAPRKVLAAEERRRVQDFVWSPDGRWIAFRRSTLTSAGEPSPASIAVVSISGGPVRDLLPESGPPKMTAIDCYFTGCLCWLPDWRIVFPVSNGPSLAAAKGSLWALNVNQESTEPIGETKQVTSWTDLHPTNLTISKDGSQLAFVKMRIQDDVYIGELQRGGESMRAPRRFTLDDRNDFPSAWMSDSSAILFDSDRNDKMEIFRQTLEGNIAEKIASNAGDECCAQVSPDGSSILYWDSVHIELGARPGPKRLMRLPVNGRASEILFEERDGQRQAKFKCPTKIGSSCVLGLEQGKDLGFYSLDLVRGKGSQLANVEVDLPRCDWSLSPDGLRVGLLDGIHPDRVQILTLANGTRHELTLAATWGRPQTIAWTADGSGFFVTCWLPSSPQLLHINLAGKIHLLLRRGPTQWLFQPVPSPNGKYLAFEARTIDGNIWLIENIASRARHISQ
jgi:Tol biopolymer transport system component